MKFNFTTVLAAYLTVALCFAVLLGFGMVAIWALNFLYSHFGVWLTGAFVVSLLALPVAVWVGRVDH